MAALTRVRPPGPPALSLHTSSSGSSAPPAAPTKSARIQLRHGDRSDRDDNDKPLRFRLPSSPLTSYPWRQERQLEQSLSQAHHEHRQSRPDHQAPSTASPPIPPSFASPVEDAQMATPSSPVYSLPAGPPMSSADVIAFVKREWEEDEKHHGQHEHPITSGAGSAQRGFTLGLHRSNIDALPAEVVLMIKDKVERIALSYNPRCQLPRELVLCDKLRYLNLKANKLQQFPSVVLEMAKLEILDLRINEIEHVPEDVNRMTNLKYLALSGNRIKRLPMSLCEMNNLVRISVQANPVEFPPAEVMQGATDDVLLKPLGTEEEKTLCIRVKKFMRTASFRAKMKSSSEDDMSESNVETPRPPRRGVMGGRFPVRPSIGSIDYNPELLQGLNDSPPSNDAPPPIPLRHHARGVSSGMSTNRWVTNGNPRLDGTESARNRSETATSSESIRSRRHGMVPHKNTQLNPVDEISARENVRGSLASTIKPMHSRASSTVSNTNSLAFGTGDASSGAVSPVETGTAKTNASLASLPEVPGPAPAISVKAMKRVLFILRYLHTPISDVVRQIRTQTPKRSLLERTLFSAKALTDELERLIHAGRSVIEDDSEIDTTLIKIINRTAVGSLMQYVKVAKEVNRTKQNSIKMLDPFHIRCLLNIAHTTATECRNVCQILGFQIELAKPKQDVTPRVSQALPQQRPRHAAQRSLSRGRFRSNNGPHTLLKSARNQMTSPRSGSISTLHVRPSLATPRFADPLAGLALNGMLPSRSNTIRSAVSESEGEEHGESMYTILKTCCELACSTLQPVRTDLVSREAAAKYGSSSVNINLYTSTIAKCDALIATSKRILAEMRLVGPARMQSRPMVVMSEEFTKEWASFASDVMQLSTLQIDISDLKVRLKPVQKAAKAAMRAAHDHPLDSNGGGINSSSSTPKYTAVPGPAMPPTPSYSYMAHNIPTPTQSVPVTPLGAALGHAAAVLPTSANFSTYAPFHEQIYPTQVRGRLPSMHHDRNDAVHPASGYGRR